MKRKIATILVFAFSASAAFAQTATEPAPDHSAIIAETVAKARAYLGPEEKLNALTTVRMEGVLVYESGESGTVEKIYKKPQMHQIVSVIGGIKEISNLKRTEAWRRLERFDQPGQWQLDYYEVHDIHRMQAAVREFFDFMKTPSARRGGIEFEGEEEIDGVTVRLLRYNHGNDIWFLHMIDVETGRVMRTLNDRGMIFVKEGEKMVDGIRFPEKLITRFFTPVGEQRLELTYSTIRLNETIPDSQFNAPLLAAP